MSKLNTKITHRRGIYSDQVANTLKDAQLFYDTSNASQGIYIGQYNQETDKVEPIKLAGIESTIEFIVLSEGEYDPTTRIPTISSPKSNAIYLVPKETAGTGNTYTEWIYTRGSWEKLGDTTVDLTSYYKKTEVDAKLEEKLNVLPNVDDPTDPGVGYPYWFPYDTVITPEADKLKVDLKTITLNNQLQKHIWNKELSGATTTTAGVMTAADKIALQGKADDNVVVKKVNNVTPTDGNVNVKTFTEVPDIYEGHEIRKNGTVEEFCQDVENYINPSAGSGYLAELSCTDLPYGISNAELLLYVPCEGIYVLELSSCGAFDRDGNSGKFITIYWGEMVMSWQGFMTCPQDSTGLYVPTKNSDGVSLYYLKKFAEKNNLQMPD